MSKKIQRIRSDSFAHQGGRCWYCSVCMWMGSPAELPASVPSARAAQLLKCTAEHLIPRSDGGRDTASNVVAACARCNRTRHKRKAPPEPKVYRNEIQRRMARGRWHAGWVFDLELAQRVPVG